MKGVTKKKVTLLKEESEEREREGQGALPFIWAVT